MIKSFFLKNQKYFSSNYECQPQLRKIRKKKITWQLGLDLHSGFPHFLTDKITGFSKISPGFKSDSPVLLNQNLQTQGVSFEQKMTISTILLKPHFPNYINNLEGVATKTESKKSSSSRFTCNLPIVFHGLETFLRIYN